MRGIQSRRPVRPPAAALAVFRPLAIAIGLRYAGARRSFISFVGALCLGGLALSVAVLVFVQAVTAGFEAELRLRILAVVPHIVIAGRAPLSLAAEAEARRTIEGIDGVLAATSVVEGPGLLAAGGAVASVRLVGIEPADYARASRLADFAGASVAAGGFGLLLGAQAARHLGLVPGDDVTVVLPAVTTTLVGAFPRQKRFRVLGLVDTGSQLDRHAAYLHRADAARLFRLGAAVHGFHVAVAAPLAAEQVRRDVLDALGVADFAGRTWLRSLGGVHEAIGATRNMLFVLLSLLVAVAAFNLVSSLVMIVNERRGDVAMLRTLGCSAGLPIAAFVVHGLAIAVVGIGGGIGAGVVLGLAAEAGFPWLERLLDTPLMSEYLVTRLPIAFAIRDIALIAATSLGLCLLATLLPAWRAARLQPADVLRHE